MSYDGPALPPSLWKRLTAFLQSGATGQVTAHVHKGKVVKLTIEEHIPKLPGE